MLHRNIIVAPARHGGVGLVAAAPIAEGEVIWEADDVWDASDRRVTNEEIATWPAQRRAEFLRYSYQVSENEWVGGNPNEDLSLLMNHSCDPNTWFVSDTKMVARRDITAGEEVTYDYATSETTASDFVCHCGTPLCRTSITAHDYTEEWFRERYQGHVLSYIAKRIA